MKDEILPRPTLMHHIVEDFLTTWNAPLSHVLPFRRFIENIIHTDVRQFFAEECLEMALTYASVPRTCEQFLAGQGIMGTKDLTTQAKLAGLIN